MKLKLIIIAIFILSAGFAYSQEKNESYVEKEQLLESVGILSSSNLYLTYLSIQLIYNTVSDTSQIDNLKGILTPMKNTLVMINEHIGKLSSIKKLSRQDVLVVKGIARACELLLEDSEMLDIYMNDMTDKSKSNFLEKHRETGQYLKELFKNEL